MASSEEDGTNGASEASDEKEAAGKRRRLGLLATAWLTFYNIAMTAGWLVLAIAMACFYMEKGTHRGLYKSIQKTLKFFQTFALLEVVHCLILAARQKKRTPAKKEKDQTWKTMKERKSILKLLDG